MIGFSDYVTEDICAPCDITPVALNDFIFEYSTLPQTLDLSVIFTFSPSFYSDEATYSGVLDSGFTLDSLNREIVIANSVAAGIYEFDITVDIALPESATNSYKVCVAPTLTATVISDQQY